MFWKISDLPQTFGGGVTGRLLIETAVHNAATSGVTEASIGPKKGRRLLTPAQTTENINLGSFPIN